MNFILTLCDPLKSEVIELGKVKSQKVIETFQSIHWKELIDKMKSAKEDEIFYSPSFGVENEQTQHSVSFSLIANEIGLEWYLFYKRPKIRTKRKWFKRYKYTDHNFLTSATGLTFEDVKVCLEFVIIDDMDFIDETTS